jgi:hypothetical protein
LSFQVRVLLRQFQRENDREQLPKALPGQPVAARPLRRKDRDQDQKSPEVTELQQEPAGPFLTGHPYQNDNYICFPLALAARFS